MRYRCCNCLIKMLNVFVTIRCFDGKQWIGMYKTPEQSWQAIETQNVVRKSHCRLVTCNFHIKASSANFNICTNIGTSIFDVCV